MTHSGKEASVKIGNLLLKYNYGDFEENKMI